MRNLSVIGKVHIKDIKALKEWHASGEFKKWHKRNWSPELAAYHHIKWEDTEQIAFYQMQNQIPELSKSLDRTGSRMSDLLEMAEYLQSIGQSLNLLYLDYPYMVIEHREDEKTTEHGTSCYIRKEYKELQGPPTFSTHTEAIENDMGLCGYGKVTEENAMEYAKWKVEYYGKDGFYCEHKSFSPEKKAYRREVYAAEHVGTERHYFISEVKEDSGYDWRTDSHKKKARANMEVYNGEFLNLTYLDSVRLRYAIANRKVTSWRIGRCDVDYAAALRYLNKALEYLDEREKKEKEMLLKYMDKLPENWQVTLTLWRKEHGYHTLTEARAKKWALERK